MLDDTESAAITKDARERFTNEHLARCARGMIERRTSETFSRGWRRRVNPTWLPDPWRQPSKHIVFKGMGLYLVSHIGIDVIDRCVIKGEYKLERAAELFAAPG